MNLLIAGVALLTAAVVALWLLNKRPSGRVMAKAPAPRTPRKVESVPRAFAQTAAPGADAQAEASEPLPPDLASFQRLAAADLPAERRSAYVAVFRDVPRPPKLLQHLMSPEFLNAANSAQLVELINAEPLIVAKVLTAVNSPLYGLKSPVSSAGQAVTYLGLNTIRSLCLQYILINTFKADSAERQKVLDATWRASALASELAHQVSYRLELPESGLLVSAVVLSFLGRLATAATMPRAVLATIPARDFLARTRAEQERLGLSAGEIGRLLMIDWGLPERIVAEAADIDSLLATPRGAIADARSHRLALGYLCARLGEQFAAGERTDLLNLDLPAAAEPELHHLRGHLGDPRLKRVNEYLRAPMLSTDLQRMVAAWQAR